MRNSSGSFSSQHVVSDALLFKRIIGQGLLLFTEMPEDTDCSPKMAGKTDQTDLSWSKEEDELTEEDEFELATCLGSGSQGRVYKISDKQGWYLAKVAKVMFFNDEDNDYQAQWREVLVHKLLTENATGSYETGILELLSYKKSNRGITITMPKCELSLAKVMAMIHELFITPEKNHLAQFLLFDLFDSLVRALNTLRNNSIVHCDIKPDNIMLSPDDMSNIVDWCLIDFGCVSMPSDAKKNAFRGTLPYVSPEALIQYDNYFPRDVWAVGYVLNELIFPSRRATSFFDCCKIRKHELEQAELNEKPIFSEADIPGGIGFNSEIEKRDFFRLIRKSLVIQEFIEFSNVEKNPQANFNDALIFLINAMMHPIPECRPNAMDLIKLLPALKLLLPASFPQDYGKSNFLAYFSLWTAEKEDNDRKQKSFPSLSSKSFSGSTQ